MDEKVSKIEEINISDNNSNINFFYLYMGNGDYGSYIGISKKENDEELGDRTFNQELKLGDVVLVQLKEAVRYVYNIGVVYGDAIKSEENGTAYLYFRKVKWIKKDININPEIFKVDGSKKLGILENINKFKDLIEKLYIKKPKNSILYGVPGCGKSHTIKNKYLNDVDEYQVERVVFHPDYTYSDFIGQILPHLDEKGNMTYKFNPGPFTKILKEAIKFSAIHYYLIIEEINRGNSPAILGDIFQLLDRNENGNSEYSISNHDIAKYVYNDKNKKIFIPSNLSIIATMNTSDQNVFTLDTAFQRRWEMELIQNNSDNCEFINEKIANSSVTWGNFVHVINDLITSKNNNVEATGDKRLGYFFVKEDELNDSKKFAHKVLKYLWDDAFKYNRDEYFNCDKYRTFEDIVNYFTSKETNDIFKIFTSAVKFS